MASVVPLPFMNPNCMSSILVCCRILCTKNVLTAHTEILRLYISICDRHSQHYSLRFSSSAASGYKSTVATCNYYATPAMGGSVAEWLACWTEAQKARVQIAVATQSGNSLRKTVHTHCASVRQAAKLVAALLRVVGVTAGLAEVMPAYSRVYDSLYLQTDCQEPGSAPEPYAR